MPLREYLCALLLLAFAAVSRAQPPNVRVSAPTITDPEEVTIAINPVAPNRLAAGSNLRYFYRSSDYGRTWIQSQLPEGTWGDPCVIYDEYGLLLYAHLANRPTGVYFIDRLVVHRSATNGVRWIDSAEVGYNPPERGQDKEWLAVDRTQSAYRNYIYMAWTEFDVYGSTSPLDSSRIRFARSTDRGVTWSTPVRVSDRGGDCIDSDNTVEGAVPAVGPNGEVYLSWSGPLGIVFDKSTDGGLTWGTDRVVTSQPGGWDFSVPGIYRCNGFPVTACDISASSTRGRVYIAWSDQRNGMDNTDVFLIASSDGGETWGPVRQVNDDMSPRHQFFHWMTIDQSTGTLWFVFYDRRATTGNATDVYVARSSDGGETFSNFRVSASSFTPMPGVFFGDYTNIAAAQGAVYPIWMRMDGSNLSVWTALVADSPATAVEAESLRPASLHLEQNYPNPFNPSTSITYWLPAGEARPAVVQVFDILGREVVTLVNEVQDAGPHTIRFDATGLASGYYYCRLSSANQAVQKRMLYIR